MKFNEKYYKDKCDQLREEVSRLKVRLCDAKAENDRILQNMTNELEAIREERDTLAENVKLLSCEVKGLLILQGAKDAKSKALLQAIRAMAQGYAMGAADNV